MAYNPFQPPKPVTTVGGVIAPSFGKPWLLYAYPWMPFPRRVIIYLREKGIPESQVKVARVQDPKFGNEVIDTSLAPRPAGSLPILAVPSQDQSADDRGYIYIRQANAIMYFLEEFCNDFQYGFAKPYGSFLGKTPLQRARIAEVMSLAEELMVAWNPVRTFGTGAGPVSIPEASREMLRWVRRALMTVERFFKDRDMTLLEGGKTLHINMADIVLYNFLEFVDDCYGVDMTIGSGDMVEDVYGRQVTEVFPKLVEFYQAFKTRESAKRDEERGEVAPEYAKSMMSKWADGVL
ncbi:hypothetical protein M409DRAFT_17361 [Zasmidium cellare ATCC 36951]|uniref:GST C-terminal domain-containing protein n=1 Tax=Zasmidium cellare ATCC 36951 TaxID=1080233 RepID=A0A6A6CYF3_ZASCE|nr:uncharacterized protein M409DRAFT_17361 [Zasmidium cellare ATCC 36951]KAF2172121.1 hypothetical protein M409DRAFT_17361 [Zasmidium cellare ATCC 36951]